MRSPAASFLLGAIDGYQLRQNMADAKTKREQEAEDRVWKREDREIARQDRERLRAREDEKHDAWRRAEAEAQRERDEISGDRKVAVDAHAAAKRSQEAEQQSANAAIPATSAPLPGQPVSRSVAPAPAPSPSTAAPQVLRPRSAAPAAPQPVPAPPPVANPTTGLVAERPQSQGRSVSPLSTMNPVGTAQAAERPVRVRSVAPAPSAPHAANAVPEPQQTYVPPAATERLPMLNPVDPNHEYGNWIVPDVVQGVRAAADTVNRATDRNIPAERATIARTVNPAVRYLTGGSEIPVPETGTGSAITGRSVAPNRTSGGAQAAAPAGTPAPAAAAAPQAAAAPRSPTSRSVAPAPQQEGAARTEAAAATENMPSVQIAAAASPAAPAAVSRSIDPGLSKDAPESKRVRSFMAHWHEVGVPQVVDHYLSTGRPKEAQAFREWNDLEAVKEGTSLVARGIWALGDGDVEKAASLFQDAFDLPGYYEDGHTIDRKQSGFIKDESGNEVGYRLTLRDRSGKTFEQTFRDEDIDGDGKIDVPFTVRFARWVEYNLAPESVFDRGAEQSAQDHAREIEKIEARATASQPSEFDSVWKELAENYVGENGLSGWYDLPPAEQERIVQETIDSRRRAREAAGAAAKRPVSRQPVDGMVR